MGCPKCGNEMSYASETNPVGWATCTRCGSVYAPQHAGDNVASQLKRIADVLEKIERHMAFNNGTLEGLTRNYDPNLNRR